MTRDPDAHGVDERVAGVAGVERDFAAHVRDADAVAIAGDAAHNPAEQVSVPGSCGRIGLVIGVERAEAQAVEQRDRPRAHREDVADDAADSRGRSLVGLDRARVVVRLHLEDDRQAVADVDDARVLARSDEHALAGGRQAPEQRTRVLVGAMLGPHGAEHAELDLVGNAAERLDDEPVLRFGQPVALLDGR